MKKYVQLALIIALCEIVGLAATPFTISAIPTWYASLDKPAFNPPNWIFGPVWTLLYSLMGIAAYMVLEKGWKKPEVKLAIYIFTAQLILNFFWSVLFFGMRMPTLAFIEILVLWISILLCLTKFYKVSHAAAYLLVPYILWVSFALVLNLSIALLN